MNIAAAEINAARAAGWSVTEEAGDSVYAGTYRRVAASIGHVGYVVEVAGRSVDGGAWTFDYGVATDGGHWLTVPGFSTCRRGAASFGAAVAAGLADAELFAEQAS